MIEDDPDIYFVKVITFMRELGIPVEIINRYWSANGPKGSSGTKPIGGSVSMYDLYEIFNDEEKRRTLIFKLKNKAFW